LIASVLRQFPHTHEGRANTLRVMLGFIISLNYYDIYYAGNTQAIPEMARIRPDIAILPIDGDGTLTVSEAAEVVRDMHPRWVIPSNWGSDPGGASRFDVEDFKRSVANLAEVVVLPQHK